MTTKLWARGGESKGPSGAYDYVMKSSVGSLQRLGMYIDLYLIHSPHGGPEIRAEFWRAMQDLKDGGKVNSIGVSNFGVKHLQKLIGSQGTRYPPAVNQVEIHPFLRRDEIELVC